MSSPRIVYSKDYYVDIGQHVFPTVKYRLIRQRLVEEGGLRESNFVAPESASDADLLLVHTKEYIGKLKNGTLSSAEILTLELPISKELVKASYICVGGTILASKIALEEGVGIHLGGGFHHAFPDHGEGFCVLNDIAVAIRRMQKDKKIKRAFIIDCDLHQGNGTAFIFSKDDSVFTLSIHQENNYPFLKPPSNLDIGLRDKVRDDEYIGNLKRDVPVIISDFKPDLIMYVAGADPYKNDMIGNLALTIDGLKRRDKFILDTAGNYGVPLACVLAGGYAQDYIDTVSIHYNTIITALER
ncbi:MAG: histone deacetylase [Candidatus Omnitrophica bacterium]|nr:histone deacetylase [Candidatus Omnitrophota bacterium]